MNPNGNGGIFKALMEEGMVRTLRRAGSHVMVGENASINKQWNEWSKYIQYSTFVWLFGGLCVCLFDVA